MRSPVYPAEYDLMGTQREGSSGAAAGGGRSEVKRSRAGSPHGEPRTEPPLLRRRRRTGVPAWRAPHSRTNYTPWGTPAIGRTGAPHSRANYPPWGTLTVGITEGIIL